MAAQCACDGIKTSDQGRLDVCRILSLERPIMDVLDRAVAMSTSFIVIWVSLVMGAYLLRLYYVSAIQTQSPENSLYGHALPFDWGASLISS